MAEIIVLSLFLPLLGFLILTLFHASLSRKSTGLIACASVLLSFLCFFSLVTTYMVGTYEDTTLLLFKWIPIKGINADFKLHLDELSLLMGLIITGVGSLIHIYSIGYMEEDPDYIRYFAFLNFFVFAMLLLVLARHLLLLYAGWEAVGLASYLLIGFWVQKKEAGDAAIKAFVMNRIGDAGLLIGILLILYTFGTGDIGELAEKLEGGFSNTKLITLITLLLFAGAVGKSAQIPLQTWLPDAMEGPTPVSALIHAATMVTAGVYLVVRMNFLFNLAPETLNVIGFIGALTSLLAAIWATSQTDLKRVLAYSTISQLGLMFLATSVGAYYAAMFHLTTHAFVKALLFLAAGNVIHQMHGVTEMNQMGGLYKKFPITHWLFLIGVLALSGVPPLSAFFSKDIIVELEHITGHNFYFYVGIIISLLTAFYLTRAYCLTFLGEEKGSHQNLIKEARPVMWVPVSILAILAIVGGFLGFCFCPMPLLEKFLIDIGITPGEKELGVNLFNHIETWFAIAATLFGVGVSYLMFTRYVKKYNVTFQFIKKAFYINEIYEAVFVAPLKKLSKVIVKGIEPHLIEGSIEGAVLGVNGVGKFLQKYQSGQVRSYIAWMVLGTCLLVAYFIF
ncbi:NADH-quinone oxidoreductase subunit L [Criblamydia sequanensis]|uniref:NADH-quinone oxidoreductase subunit L n=1 Tax=Candidatus Criblamydia sequanensis CRIB-18 TaxID=1437425 RepID=A0A090D1B6_9BACT|nr:NADH-quinone oxidoreductase subunit L [Criblamydia sequanensis]CDR33443.1 NADH-quinone oxidoreductase subunit L [Criblamydia sequanensis CRIB-18]